MRKLVATLTFLAVVALPATALAQPHWYRGGNAQVTVYVEKTRVGATNWSYVKRAGIEWARSSRIRIVFVKDCPSRYYCLKVYEGSSTRPLAGWTTLNYDPKTDTAWYGNLHLNNRYLTSAAARRKTACHKLGHAVGLGHRRTGTTCMRDGFTTMYGHRRHRLRQPAPGLRLIRQPWIVVFTVRWLAGRFEHRRPRRRGQGRRVGPRRGEPGR